MASALSYAGMGVAQRRSPETGYRPTNEKNGDIQRSSGGKFSFRMANVSVQSSSSFSSIARLRCLCRRTPSWHHHDACENDDQHIAHNVVQIHATLSNKVRRRPRILEVSPNPRNGLASMVIDWMERLVIKLLYHPPLEPNLFLSGNFAPVGGEAPLTSDLTIRGCLPDCLNGEFMGVGPNSKFAPIAGYHWFDGDGMVHALRFKDGKASYVSHFVQTSRLKQEEFFGGSKFGKIGDLKGLLGLASVGRKILREKLNILDVSFGTGQANTSLVYHGGMLLALQETDKPYVLKVQGNGDFETLGILDYDGKLSHSFTAHPKVDPFTGEMFAFSCGYTPPFLAYIRVSKEGVMHDPVDISIPEPVLMHDFAITENYAIFLDLSLCFRPKDMLMENTLVYSFDPMKKSRFGVLQRYAKNDLSIKWFELPCCFIFHNANAWEDGDELVLITSRIETAYLDVTSGAIKEKPKNNRPELYEMRFNMGTGVASQRKLSAPALEFPHINQQFTGRKHRYVYGSSVESTTKVTAVIKFDLHKDPDPSKPLLEIGGNIEGIYELGPGKFGSSVLFVPRDPGAQSEKEDDGYLIFFEHDENTGKSYVNVIDAKTMSADPVAVIELPCRVPYLFHTCFLTEEQLGEQAT